MERLITTALNDIDGYPILAVASSIQGSDTAIRRLSRCRIYAQFLYRDSEMIQFMEDVVQRHERFFPGCLIEV